MSDMEHLLLSDLVIVGKAHNFDLSARRRTTRAQICSASQPRKDLRRKVLLLTAPVLTASKTCASRQPAVQQASLAQRQPHARQVSRAPSKT